MYCTNCGRKLPEDGSPCICGAQNGKFNTQPPQNFQAPPQYYAQPPVRPVTPVHEMLKRFASSKLFFMCALLFTVQMSLNFYSSFLTLSGFSKFRIFVPTLSGNIFCSIIYYHSTSIILLFSSNFLYFSFILSIYSVYLYI